MKPAVVVKCHADGSWLSSFGENGQGIFRYPKRERIVLGNDDPRLKP